MFEAFVARAAELGHCSSTGRTPRELLARLGEAELIEASEAVGLRYQLEAALYGAGLPAAEVEELRDVMRRVEQRVEARGSVLPEAAPEPREARALHPAWLQASGGLLLAVALVFLLPKLECSPSSGMASGSTGASALAGGGARDWALPQERAHWRTVATPPTLIPRFGVPSFDLDTGDEFDFKNAGEADPMRPRRGWTHRRESYDVVTTGARFAHSSGAYVSALGTGDGARERSRVSVDLVLLAGSPTPVPTPSADFEVVSWECTPRTELEFVRDSTDSLLVLSDVSRSVHLEYEIASFADYHTAPLPDTPFVPQAIALPDDARADAEQVLARIGELEGKSYAATVLRLHKYFSGFVTAPLKRAERVGSDYLSIALARKGVCRHRAQAFVVTAQALGLPARYVVNRIHAFAEVQLPDGAWRRLEFRLVEAPPDVNGWLLLGATFAGALLLIHRDQRRVNHSYVAGSLERDDRTKLRAQVDSSSGHQAEALARLLAVVRQRVALELGCVDTDADALSAALAEAELAPLLTRHIEQVLELSRALQTSEPPGAAELQHAYWNSYHVLRVLDGSAPW